MCNKKLKKNPKYYIMDAFWGSQEVESGDLVSHKYVALVVSVLISVNTRVEICLRGTRAQHRVNIITRTFVGYDNNYLNDYCYHAIRFINQ